MGILEPPHGFQSASTDIIRSPGEDIVGSFFQGIEVKKRAADPGCRRCVAREKNIAGEEGYRMNIFICTPCAQETLRTVSH